MAVKSRASLRTQKNRLLNTRKKDHDWRQQASGKIKFFSNGLLNLRSKLNFFTVVVLVLLGIGGVSLGLVHAYKYFTTSAYFAVKTIDIDGNTWLKSREVLDIAGISVGMNTLALSIDDMEKALARNPWVNELSIRRILPDRFSISIREREPKYWVNIDGALHYADINGKPIAQVTTENFALLPTLEVETGAEHLVERLPFLVQSFNISEVPLDVVSASWIRLTNANTMELRLKNNLFIAISLEHWNRSLSHLARVLQDLSRRGELKNTTEIRVYGNNVWVSAKKR